MVTGADSYISESLYLLGTLEKGKENSLMKGIRIFLK